MRVDVDPARFQLLSERERLLWARKFARDGHRLDEISSFIVDDEQRVVETVISIRRPTSIDFITEPLRIRWFEIPLCNRTVRRFTA